MDTRTKILDAALGLLARGGAQALTQPRICRAAGVRQSHLTYYFPTIHDLLQGVAKYSLEAMLGELGRRDPAQRSASLSDLLAGFSADKRRMRMVLGLVTMTDRDARLKPRMREFIKEVRQELSSMARAGGLAGTPDQAAFLHGVVVGQGMLQLLRDNDDAREEGRRMIANAVDFLRRQG